MMPPAAVANVGTCYAAKKDTVKRAYINELALLSEEWDDPDLSDELGSYTITDMQPHILQAKANKHDADNPTYTQAMNSPNADKWYEAAQIELKTLEDINAWSLVKREPWMKVLPMTWAFKLKRFPDGLAKKFKARFCVRGDRQIEGVDFFETWAPVVQWTTVRAMIILAAKQKIFTAQADLTAAFVHAPLAENEHIYVEQPKGFSENDIDNIISNLHSNGVQIRKEGSAEGFLGVDVQRVSKGPVQQIKLTQHNGLTKRVVEALGLCSNYSNAISTPAENAPLPKDANGAPAARNFNYAAVVGMLLYLSRHSRPDIAFAVHQCARYTFNPTRRHELALIRIGRYIKGTMERDFAGLMYGHEDVQDPHCASSRTGYVILAFGCPVLWKSKLQTEIALSTMEAEYVAMSQACKDLFPVVNLIRDLSKTVGLPSDFKAKLHIKIHEDNVGALTLGKLEPQRMTPRSKHYAIKYHWFREKVADPSNCIVCHFYMSTVPRISPTTLVVGIVFAPGHLSGVPSFHQVLEAQVSTCRLGLESIPYGENLS
eukprot:scaffold85834_cov44-Cyclotella_meneghiniana.AAC.4